MRKSPSSAVSSWNRREAIENENTSESRSSESRSFSSSVERQMTNGVRGSSTGNMTLYNTVIEEKIIIEQVDTSAQRLAEQLRISIEERYSSCFESVQNLLSWLSSIEKALSAQEILRESSEEIKQQISSIKYIHDEVWTHSEDVNSTLAQIRTLLVEGTTILSPQNLSTLEDYGDQLKKRYDRASKYSDQLLRKATNAYDEIRKYENERDTFNDWLKRSCHTLVEIEKGIENLTIRRPERVNEFVSEVISHKAELRFLEMTGNRFNESSQEHLVVLNEMRSQLSQRLPALRKKGSEVDSEIKEINGVYNDLLDRANKLLDKLAFGTRQKDFQNAVDEAISWLKSMTPRVQKVVDEPLATNPREAEDQLRRAKGLKDEIVSGRGKITAVTQAANNLVDSLPPAERSAVQKTVKGIEEKYDSLLNTMNSKIQDLESGSALVNLISENIASLRRILDKEEGRLPKNHIGNSALEAESIKKTLDSILRTLDDNQGLLDSTRTNINKLLANGQGNEGMKSNFVQIQERWSALDKNCKDRLSYMDLIKNFFNQLEMFKSWLDDKEKNIKNLGQGSPDMQYQLNQIRSIRQEFRAQAPKLDALNGAGDTIMKWAMPSEVEKSKVESSLIAVNQKWEDLLRKLDDREKNLEDLLGASSDFDRNLKKLEEALRRISDNLDGLDSKKSRMRPEELLAQLIPIEASLKEKKPVLADVEAAGAQLCDILKDPAAKADVKQKLADVGRLYNQCLQKLDNLRHGAEGAQKEVKDFEETCGDALDWVNQLLNQLNKIQVSADRNILKDQVSQVQRVYQETMSKKSEITRIINKGKELAKRHPSVNVDTLQQSWTRLENEATKTQSRVLKCMDHCQKYDKAYHTFTTWLTSAEDKLESYQGQMTINKSDLEIHIRKMDEFKKELRKRGSEFDQVNFLGETFLNSTDRDKDGVERELRELAKRWESLNQEFERQMEELENANQKLDAEQKALNACKDKLAEINSNLADLERELNGMKGIGRTIPLVENQLKEVGDFQRRLAKEKETFEHVTNHIDQLAKKGLNTAPLIPQIEHTKRKFQQLGHTANQRHTDLDDMLKRLQEFYRLYKRTDGELNDLIRQAPSLTTIQALEKFRARELKAAQKDVDEVNREGQNLIKSAGRGVDTNGLETDLEKLNQKWKQLNEMITAKQNALEKGLLKAKELADAIANLMSALRKIEQLVIDDSRVHGDIQTVKGLIRTHKEAEDQLQSRRIQMQNILRSATEIMEKTSNADEKTKISQQVFEMKEYFEKVKTKCEQRTEKLEGALKDAEKMERSVHGMLEWLATAEKRKRAFPDSFQNLDEAATNKLIIEQEKLLREIEGMEKEKNSTIEFCRLILSKAHPNAITIIKNWISTIESKWDALSDWAEQIRKKLQDRLAALRENSEFINELLAWLRKREEALQRLEPIPLPNDIDEIKILIREHIEFMEAVENRTVEVNSVCGTKSGSMVTGKRVGATKITSSTHRGHSPSPIRDGKSLGLFPSLGPKFDKMAHPIFKSPLAKSLWDKWKDVWKLCWERQRRLERKYEELMRKFNWDEWRKRFLKHMNHNKDRIKALFTKHDRKNTGLVPRHKFMDAITGTDFPTNDLEMNEVANMFDNGNDDDDYIKFIAALRPDWEEKKPVVEATLINDEIQRQVQKCTCKQRFRVEQVAEGTYRFGESQKLRLVRILRSTVMVRVGGGWVTLEEFLQKNDPCRVKGRTNIELREQLHTPEGATEILAAFTAKRRGGDSSRTHSPSPVRQPEQGIWKSRSTY